MASASEVRSDLLSCYPVLLKLRLLTVMRLSLPEERVIPAISLPQLEETTWAMLASDD